MCVLQTIAVNESENLLMHTFFQNDDDDDDVDDIHTSAETDTF